MIRGRQVHKETHSVSLSQSGGSKEITNPPPMFKEFPQLMLPLPDWLSRMMSYTSTTVLQGW
jgi:hypothetical protein